MNRITLPAYAKLNLTFSILGTLPNGYHSVETIMQKISLADTVTISPADKTTVSCGMDIPIEKNLAYKAALLFFELYKKEIPVRIDILKKIPEGAGMGGGSADAATVLVGLNQITGNPFSMEFLEEKSVSLGADVPFLIRSSTALCTGIGEIITPINPKLDSCSFLIVKPEASKSTAHIYAEYDSFSPKPMPADTNRMVNAIQKKDFHQIGNCLSNAFEPMMGQKVPDILSIKSALLSAGALGSIMTGSGTAVYGLFPSLEKAEKAKRLFENTNHKTFIAVPV